VTDLNRYEDELRAELGAMTVKQLRQYAREHRVPLAGASAKRDIVSEIALQMRHWEYLRQCEAEGARA
jgi:hypothetical protein